MNIKELIINKSENNEAKNTKSTHLKMFRKPSWELTEEEKRTINQCQIHLENNPYTKAKEENERI